jgi:hypothetical protein
VGLLDGAFPKQLGFKVHPSLVLDALSGFPLGFAEIRLWERPMDRPNKAARDYQRQPLKEKESYKWFETSAKSRVCLARADAVVIVQDREGDILDQFTAVTDPKTYLLVRSRVNRKLCDHQKLWSKLEKADLAGVYTLDIAADTHHRAAARQANMEVRFTPVAVSSARRRLNEPPLTLYAIEAKETGTAVQKPVLWRLLTNWPVENFDQARMIIEWYTCRWVIEEVFRLLKKEGFNIEQSEIESGWAIRKLCVWLLDTVLRVLQLHMAYHLPEGEHPPADSCFTDAEQQCLALMNTKAEGQTAALQNPFPPSELRWAAWIMARQGGWKGYQSQRPPGMTTIWRGLQRFYEIFEGWTLAKDVGTR